MPRAPLQVLVIPFRRCGDGRHEFAVLRRADGPMWQFVAGGGEDDEAPAEAARREAREEAGIPDGVPWLPLDSIATVPRSAFPGGTHWPDDVYVVPEHCFAVDVSGHDLRLSNEHDAIEWLDYEQARRRLTWQSNRNALWELRERLRRPGMAV
jgi:dATP pyrophosphohydrolase